MTKMEIINELEKMGYEVQEHTVDKNGIKKEGLIIRSLNGEPFVACPVVYPGEIIRDYGDDVTAEYAVKQLVEYLKRDKNSKNIELRSIEDKLLDKDYVLQNVYPKAINDKNLEETDYISRKVELSKDISLILYVDLGFGLTNVTKKLQEFMKIPEEMLWIAAASNITKRAKILDIDELLGSDLGLGIYTIINENKEAYGAGILCNLDFIRQACVNNGWKAAVVIPSSMHELIIADSAECDLDTATEMCTKVNMTEVKPEEFLSNNPFIMEI